MDFFRASSYGSGTVSEGSVALNLDGMRTEVEGRHIIVVRQQSRMRVSWANKLQTQFRCSNLANV